MGSSSEELVSIPSDLYETFERRAASNGFDSTKEYIEYILYVVAYQVEDEDNADSSEDIRSRLESLGYLE